MSEPRAPKPTDLGRYFERIAWRGAGTLDVETLHALTQAHAQAIPFENIDVLLHRPIDIEPEAIWHKLVEERRGGYCFEQNGLFLEILRTMGFDAHPLGGRVRLGTPDRSTPVARTHMLLEVRLAGERWITDVGVGTATLTCALRLQRDREQPTPHDTRRLVFENDRWYHQMRQAQQWVDVYEFTEDEMPLIDRKLANWYTSTSPDSSFAHRLVAARALPHGRRVNLRNNRLSIRAADGSAQQYRIDDPRRMPAILREYFGIVLPATAVLRYPSDPA